MNQAPASGLETTELSDQEFQIVADLAARMAGLEIPSGKRSLVSSRLSRRMRRLGLQDFADYVRLIQQQSDPSEQQEFVSALTTNVTSFYREKHHFEFLLEQVLPHLEQKMRANQRIRIWSAGCSKGHEPYTIAMTLLDAHPAFETADFRILATDIDQGVLATAREGTYSIEELIDVPVDQRNRHFSPAGEDTYSAGDKLRSLVQFRELNLHGSWPMSGKFDIIFCRNVTIYFSAEMSNQLWGRYHDILHPGGWLFLGHSERLPSNSSLGFKPVGITTYQKQATDHGTS